MNLAFTFGVPVRVGDRQGCKSFYVARKTLPVCTAQKVGETVASRLATAAKHTVAALVLVMATSGNGHLGAFSDEWIAPSWADDSKSSYSDVRPQLKVSGGSASTSGGERSSRRSVTKTVTRGITLENADFSNGDFEGVSFQQSILRQANFSNSILKNASFFDADLTGANFSNADLSNTNVSLPLCIFDPR